MRPLLTVLLIVERSLTVHDAEVVGLVRRLRLEGIAIEIGGRGDRARQDDQREDGREYVRLDRVHSSTTDGILTTCCRTHDSGARLRCGLSRIAHLRADERRLV